MLSYILANQIKRVDSTIFLNIYVKGLADGAGGNRSIGIDPQKFSRSLLGYCVEIIKKEDVIHNQMAKLACKSIQILESKNIQGISKIEYFKFEKKN